MKPIIGLTMHQEEERMQINEAYVKSIEQAGGIPLCIPYTSSSDISAIISKIDGLILIGGHDMDPSYFDEDPHQKIGRFQKKRDESDLEMLRTAFEQKMPILAICRGLQVLNVAFGGSLIQDIPAQVEGAMAHSQVSKRSEQTHYVQILGGKLKELYQAEKLHVNSFHHQSVSRLGEGLIVTAKAADGIIEAIEHEKHPYCIGVQWHPEELATNGVEEAKVLFENFIEACKKDCCN